MSLLIVFSESKFHVGKYLELEFDFRTSEMNGVLLSVSETKGFPALSIEMYHGKVGIFGVFLFAKSKVYLKYLTIACISGCNVV